MIKIHVPPPLRRLAELTEKAHRIGGYPQLSPMELYELFECLDANLIQIRKIDELNGLFTAASVAGDIQWLAELEQRAVRTLKGGRP